MNRHFRETPPHAPAAPVRPLFRPEAAGEPEYGEAFAFAAPGWRQIGLWVAAAAALLLLSSLFADFDRVAQVRGFVTPASGVARLRAPRDGIVTAVPARLGQSVPPGAPLVRIASAVRLPGGMTAPAEMLATYRRQQQIARQGQAAERERAEAERKRLVQQVAELAAGREALGRQIALQRERIDKNQARLVSLGPLRTKGYVSDLAYQSQEETVLTLRQQLAALEQKEAEAAHEMEKARLRIAELGAEVRRAELQSAQNLLELERGAAGSQAQAEVMLAAPFGGTVTAVRAAPGMTVAAAEELVAVTRTGETMEALLLVPSRASGFLRPGQEVRLRYDAFPYQRYGLGRGTVADIASTASPEPMLGNQPAYRVRVRLAEGGRSFHLRSDMMLTASIVLERRSLLDWLLAPLRERWRERKDAAVR